MAFASEAFAEPVHEGPDYELAGNPCSINAYEVMCCNFRQIQTNTFVMF